MSWMLSELVRGEAFPNDIYWPEHFEAFIPVDELMISSKTLAIPKEKVQLFIKDIKTQRKVPLVWIDESGQQEVALNIAQWIKDMQSEKYRPEHQRPLSALLPFHYHQVPAQIRNIILSFSLKVANSLGSHGKVFPVSVFNVGPEMILSLLKEKLNFPFQGPMFVLSHDIDTLEGFQTLEKIAEIEEQHGFRSIWNVVPFLYKIDKAVLKKLLDRGHEIGLHGLWHDTREAFLEEKTFAKELERLKDFFIEFQISGYRSPSWCRTPNMFKVVAEFFEYDLSCLDNDMISPSGCGGVGFMRPFVHESGLLELPCTLPYEAPLFSGTGKEELNNYWKPKIEFIRRHQALLLIDTHPDSHYLGNEPMLKVYADLLESLQKENWGHCLPRDLAGIK